MSHLTRPLLLAAAFLAVHAGPAFAQAEFTIRKPGGGTLSYFGFDCALDGRRAVVSKDAWPEPFVVFERTASEWSQSSAPYVGPPDLAPGIRNVDVDGFTIVSGSYYSGVSVYELQGGAWNLKQVLGTPDIECTSVAVQGDTIAVTTFANGVLIWRRVGGQWMPDVPNPLPGYRPVVIDGDRIACGGTHVYRRTNGVWLHEQSIPILVNHPKGLALSGDTLLVAYRDRTRAESYTFDGTSWELEDVLFGYTPGTSPCSVALDGDLAVVGHPAEDGGQGVAQVLQRHGSGMDAWRLVKEWTHEGTGGTGTPALGLAVAVSGGVALATAPYQGYVPPSNKIGLGVGYIYEVAPEPGTAVCFGDGSGAACPCANESPRPDEGCLNSTGAGMTIDGDGSASVSAYDLRLFVGNLPHNQGQFFVGRASWGAGIPFYDGLLCAGGNVRRFGEEHQTDFAVGEQFVAAEGTGTYFQAGTTYWFQYWTRDPSGSPCGNGAALSPAYRVTYTP